MDKWTIIRGDWKTEGSLLSQSQKGIDALAILEDREFDNCTIELKAKKISGTEGFRIVFGGTDSNNYFMADIGLRMLTPRELYMANGFPRDYKIERDYTGREYPKTKQVARCGNAVPPPFATALVRANLPEWCGEAITTMEELEKAVAV